MVGKEMTRLARGAGGVGRLRRVRLAVRLAVLVFCGVARWLGVVRVQGGVVAMTGLGESGDPGDLLSSPVGDACPVGDRVAEPVSGDPQGVLVGGGWYTEVLSWSVDVTTPMLQLSASKTTSSSRRVKLRASSRVSIVLATVMLMCVILALLMWRVPSVLAAGPVTFCPAGSAAGQCFLPEGVAVDHSDGIAYVADRQNRRIDEFEGDGTFVRAFGFGVVDGKEELETCTTVCQPGFHHEGGGPGTLPGEIRPIAVAADSSGDVYVSDEDNYRVEKFDSEGHFLLMFGGGVNKTAVERREEQEAKSEPVTVTAEEEDLCTQAELEGGEVCGAGGPGSGPGQFSLSEPDELPLAVDGAGDVWVGDPGRLEKFSPGGVLLGEVGLMGAGIVESFAVEGEPLTLAGGKFYVLENGGPGVREYEPSGMEAGSPLDKAGNANALALDPATGDVFVSDQAEPGLPANYGTASLLEYDSAGVLVEVFGSGEVSGGPRGNALAVGEDGGARALYVAGGQESVGQVFAPLPALGVPLVVHGSTKAVEVHKTGVTLNALVNPEGAETSYHFEYVDDHDFETEGGFASPNTVKTGESASIGEGFEAQTVSFEIPAGQLTLGSVYHFRVVASNVNAVGGVDGEDATVETLPAVRVDSTFVTEVTSDSAVLDAQVNPLGDDTTYHFEYVSQSQFEAGGFAGAVSVPVADGDLGAGVSDVLASGSAQGLQADTVYRYRLVAHNEHEGVRYAVEGTAETFTTQGGGGSVLPDGREWEMVSPPDKLGALIEPITEEPGGVIQAAAAGNAITYHSNVPTEHGVEGNDIQVQVLSRRGPDGWQTKDIVIPHPVPTGIPVNSGQDYRFFSEDLSLALVQPIGEFKPSLSPEASEQTPYLRSNYLGGNVQEPCLPASMHCYRPLVTGTPGVANVPERTHFGEEGRCPLEQFFCGPYFDGASPDLSHIILSSAVPLTNPPSTSPGGGPAGVNNGEDFYEWSGGGLQPFDAVLPVSEGGATVPIEAERIANEPAGGVTNGGTVFFPHGGHLYFYDFSGDELVRVDVAQGVPEPPVGEAGFLYASGDGSTVLFSDPQRLTAAAGGGVYECRMVRAAGGVGCELELTGLAGGSLVGGRGDASYLYFVGGGGRLLVDHREGGHWTTTQGPAGFSNHTFRISPNGQWLAFMSSEDLTGYDTRDVSSGQPDEEVYLYGAVANKLVCASCEPTGARPAGVEANRGVGNGVAEENAPLIDAKGWRNTWLAANVPGLTSYATVAALYQSRYLSDSGRLFFNSLGGLVPRDKNNTWDVYEYEPVGVGSCGAGSGSGSVVFKPARAFEVEGVGGEEPAGCVGLISAGSSSDESAFLDASESGGDVFFLSTSRLSRSDYDNSFDVYDAHVCTGVSPCLPVPAAVVVPCGSGDSCRAAPTPQPGFFGLPASATFSGAGNLTPLPAVPVRKTAAQLRAERLARALRVCKRDKGRGRRVACERLARRKYGAVKASKSGRAKRAGSRRGAGK